MNQRYASTRKSNITPKRLLLILALIVGCLPVMGQAVIMNGNYFLTHNDAGTTVNTAATTTFNPATCLWDYASRDYIRTANSSGEAINNNNNYLQYTSLSLGTDWGNWYRGGDEEYIYHRTGGTYSRRYHYPTLSGTTWGWAYNQTSQGGTTSLYNCTITTTGSTSTNPTISGADVITGTGNTTFTASGAVYQAGYKNYYFINANHYFDNNGNGFTGTPGNATIGGYTWTLTDNSYATVNSSGVVNVSSLPESDITLTLTVTAAVTGGTPAAPAGTTLTGTKEIIIQGTKPSAPIISVSGTSVTMSTTAAGTTTIRYTLDGTTPTATSGTVYSGAIDLSSSTSSPVTIKAITVRNGNTSEITEQSVTLTIPEPTITINGEAQTATITSSVAGATIYYTTDGTTPTTSSSQYTGTLTGLDYMTTVKAIAVKDGWNNSPVASGIVTIPSGVSGDVVTLFDYEPHSWSYYSDPDCPIRSLNPADVKITYYGDGIVMTGNADYTASSTDFIQPGNANYVGGAKVNVGGEDENTFIYYKTLERGDATQTAWTFSSGNQSSAASRCPYTTIPNPFQVRPTYGSRGTTDANDFTGWRGFQCWRLKSVTGGAVYSAASGGTALTTGAVINAGIEIYFAPNSEYGMEVQLEAVWARAYLIKGNNGGANAILNYGNLGVERNFMTLTANENYRFNGTQGRRITNVDRAVTISCYYPSGEAPDNTNGVVVGNNNNITLGANTKFENVTLSAAAYTLTTSGYDVIIGRGCTSTNIGTVRGLSDNTSGAVEYTIRLESGTFGTFNMIDGTTHTHSGTVSAKTIFGCDYDRAKGDNSNLSIGSNNTVYGASQYQAFSSNTNRNNLTYDWNIKSGKVQASKDVAAGSAAECIYMGNSGNGYDSDGNLYQGKRRMIMEGGEVCNIAGGLNNYGNNYANYIVNDGWALQIRIKGGTVRGSVYGAAEFAGASGDRQFIITGGTINGWVAGGANGTHNDGGELYGSTALYIGGTAVVGSESGGTHVGGYNATYGTNGADGGNVFGAGCGIYPNNGNYQTGTVGRVNNSVVAVADEATIWRDVYGGGNYGWVRDNGTTGIYILGGTVNGSVFGGSNNQQGQEISITMKGGTIKGNTIGDASRIGGLYGGSNSWGTINDNVTMQIDGGQIGTSSKNANIHGGGYGSATRVSQNVEITLGTTTQTTPGVTVYGDVYGGSALGYVNGTSATGTYHTYVTLNKGTINGSLYGGGLGDGSTAANVYGPVQVKVFGGSVNKTDANGANGSGGVYGANNVNGAPQRSVTVDIYGTDPAPSANEYALFAVYGGGNQADYTYGNGYPKVTVHNCDNSIEYVYGGGNAAAVAATDVKIYGGNTIGTVFGGGNGTVTAANVTGNASTNIYGGTIGRVFGGSNSQGTIGGTISVNVNKQGDTDPNGSSTACDMKIGELYGGGNLAASNVGSITIGCTGSLTAGHSEHPENIGTTLEGIGYVYGGANQANITGDITLIMNSGIVGNLFGGNNTSGSISGGIQVNVEKDNSATCASDWYVGNVFGGGNLAQYSIPSGKSLAVNVLNGAVSGNVYGGGKGDPNDHSKGQVTGAPVVTIGDNTSAHAAYVASVAGDVYGGGDAGDVLGTPQVNVVNKCNTTISGDVYGGGNAADVNGTDVNIDGGIITGMVFGGGHGNNDPSDLKVADVKGNVDVDITGGTINKVFAGSNLNGTITGTVTLDINKSTASGACDMIIGEVYGGGNEAAGKAGTITVGCTGALTTQASNPTQIGTTLEGIGAVYGGANKADIGTSSSNSNITLNINSGMVGNVYGGNNTSGDIHGTIQVNIEKTSDACGWYVGDVFGGGNLADYGGTPDVNIIAGTVSGSVFGGGNAADVAGSDVEVRGGQINGGVYGGCNAEGDTGPVVIRLTGGQVGTSTARADVFGGGLGAATTTSGDITVTFGNGTTSSVVYGDIYGGSAFGSVNSASANPANTTTLTINGSTLYGTIYGGGKGDVASLGNGHSDVTAVSNGDVVINYTTTNAGLTGLYGGANINGNVKGDITVNVLANVGASGTNINVFGGGLGVATQTEGDVTVKFGTENLSIAPVIYGNIYGGSSQGQVGSTQGQSGATNNNTTVYIYNGTVRGNVYGGGLGVKNATGNYDAGTYVVANDSIEAVVNGNALVYIGTAAQTSGNNVVITGNVFGGSDLCGNTLGDITVHIYHTGHDANNEAPNQSEPNPDVAAISDLTLDPAASAFALQGVYGGGNLAHYKSTGLTSEKKASVYVHGCDNSIQYLYGGGNAANTTRNYVEIDGGRFNKIFGGGNGELAELPGANITNGDASHVGATTIVKGGVFNYIFGGSNTKGDISGGMYLDIEPNGGCGRMIVANLFGGGNVAPCDGGELTVKCGDLVVGDVYGGANLAPVLGDVILNIEGGNLNNVFGGSRGVAADPANSITGVAADIDGSVTLNLKGGTMTNAFGGSDQNGNITGKITVNVLENSSCPLSVDYVYGGGNVTAYTPTDATSASPEVNIKHLASGHSITHDVFGGGLGQTAVVTARPMVIIGDDDASHTATVSGSVYGGGSLAAVSGNTTVLVKNANTNIAGNVFGGGSQAGISGTTTVQVANGTVGTGVYGGCNVLGSVGGTAEVIVTGGAIGSSGQHANVYGGGLGPDTRMNGDVLVTIGATNGGTPPTYSGSAVITGDVYGGSAKGKTNCNDAGTAHQGSSKTDVTLYGGTIDGDLYGGGHGIDNAAANVYGPVQVTVNKGTVTGSVYGCNNAAGAPQSTVKVDIYGTDAPGSGLTYALGNVFGGGNQAAYGGTPDVTIHNCDNSIGFVYGGGNKASVAATNVCVYGGNTIGYVFGGGNGEGVAASYEMVEGDAVTNIHGGTILHVFGGNNSSGKISGAVTLTVNKQAEGSGTACDMKIGEVYGGGNLAAGNAGAVNIGCTGDWTTTGTNNHTNHNNTDNRIGYELEGIGTVYGGANAADIGSSSNNSNITLNINSGMVDNVFGGNNTSGTIYGTIQVNINKTSDACSWYVGNVFGGGNLADYSGVPVVTLTNGPVSHNIYGGGNEAGVGGSLVNINGGSVGEGVYGGCNTSGKVSGNIIVNITGDNTTQTTIGTDATHRANIHGGGYGEDTETTGNVTVNFGTLAYDNTSGTPVEIHSEFPKLYGDVYGGSALGEVNGGPTNKTTVNILNGELITNQTTSANGFPVYNGGNVFGGGLGRKAASGVTAAEAKVYGTVTVNIGGPHSRTLNPDDDTNVGRAIIQGNVYGCNNTNGSPQDSVVVNIYRTNRTADDEIYGTTYALHNVFGGGNEADYIPASGASNKKLKVYVHNCYNSIERVFGGSNAAAAGAVGNTVTVHTLIEGGRFNNVFGGGNGEVSAANIKGDVKLEIHGGIVNEFFVGSNQSGTITGNSHVIVDEASHCESVLITEFFCGGKYADVEGNIEASINCSDALTVTNLYGGCKEADVTAGNGQPGNVHLSVYGGHYTNVFGGSKGDLSSLGSGHSDNSADIAGNVVLDLYGGTMENVYGGSNVNGNISGTITVNVIDAESQTCPLYITNIYGGSNLTSYTPTNGANLTSPVVNVVHIKSGVRGNVYGASKGVVGTAATVTANPQVNIGYDATQMSSLATYLSSVHYSVPTAPRAIISGSVFGGGDAATVIGNTEIFLRNKAKVFGNVYGGGNMGEVTGNTKVIVNGQNN